MNPLPADAGQDKLMRAALILVMGAALVFGTWSIYTLLTKQFHVPWYIAVFGATMFDAAALFLALLSHKYAKSPDSGLAPRLAMLAAVTASSWVNWQHAKLENWGKVGGVLLASAPIVAEASFELWRRWTDREARRAQGRTPTALAVLGPLAWLRYPKRSYDAQSRQLLHALETATAGHPGNGRAALPGMPGYAPDQPGTLPGGRPAEAIQMQTVRLEIVGVATPAPPAAGHLVPALTQMPGRLPEPALAAQAPDGQTAEQTIASIAEAVRAAITEVGTGIDAITARATELKPGASRDSIRREARRQVGQLPGTGFFL